MGNLGLLKSFPIRIQANHCGYPPEGSDVEYEPCNAWLPSVFSFLGDGFSPPLCRPGAWMGMDLAMEFHKQLKLVVVVGQ